MQVDYQKKYNELQILCRKHEETITKLQQEIRERCQSYLLYSSRMKRTSIPAQQSNLQQSSKRIETKTKQLSQSKVEEFTEDVSAKNGEFPLTQEFVPQTPLEKSQISIVENGEPASFDSIKLVKEDSSRNQAIEEYKERITKINAEKSKYFKQGEKLKEQLLQARNKIQELESRVEKYIKEQKKAKNRIKTIQLIQETISQIYERMTEPKANNEGQDSSDQNLAQGEKIEWFLSTFGSVSQAVNFPTQVSSKTEEIKQISSQSSAENNNVTESKIIGVFTPVNFQDEIREKLEEERLYFSVQMNQFREKHEKQISELTKRYEERIKRMNEESKSPNINKDGYNEEKNTKLEKLLQQKEECISWYNSQLLHARQLLEKSKIQLQKHQKQIQIYKEQSEASQKIIEQYQKTKEQLDKSRSIIHDLEHSKLTKSLQVLKQSSSQISGRRQDLTSSTIRPNQLLQQPYYVEEELYHDPADPYVKRSFIRKKIVKRTYSASAYRVNSNSPDLVNSIIQSRVKNISDRSLEKKDRIKESSKTQKQSKLTTPEPRISEISEQNRQSGYIADGNNLVKVIEVASKTPGQQIRMQKIY